MNKGKKGNKVLIVDEVDDTRATLQFCINKLIKENYIVDYAVCVIHNKIKKKVFEYDTKTKYFTGENLEDKWIVYPWD